MVVGDGVEPAEEMKRRHTVEPAEVVDGHHQATEISSERFPSRKRAHVRSSKEPSPKKKMRKRGTNTNSSESLKNLKLDDDKNSCQPTISMSPRHVHTREKVQCLKATSKPPRSKIHSNRDTYDACSLQNLTKTALAVTQNQRGKTCLRNQNRELAIQGKSRKSFQQPMKKGRSQANSIYDKITMSTSVAFDKFTSCSCPSEKFTAHKHIVDHMLCCNNTNLSCHKYEEKVNSDSDGQTSVFDVRNTFSGFFNNWRTTILPSLSFMSTVSNSLLKHSVLIMVSDTVNMKVLLSLKKRKRMKTSKSCIIGLEDNGSIAFNPGKLLGEGAYGFVLSCSSLNISITYPRYERIMRASAAVKISDDIGRLSWELLIHQRVQSRVLSTQSTKEMYLNHFLPPDALLIFNNASIMSMEQGNLGTLVSFYNVVYARVSDLRAIEIEWCCTYFTYQALRALLVLHSASVLHSDIKLDNWVLQSSEEKDDIHLNLIDFGKAIDLKEMKVSTESHQVALQGSTAVSGFECPQMKNNTPWSYQADYYGVVATIHILIFGEDLNILSVPTEEALKRGYDYTRTLNMNDRKGNIWIPSVRLKRYWDCSLWSVFYTTLLNAQRQIDLPQLIALYEKQLINMSKKVQKNFLLRKLKIALLKR